MSVHPNADGTTVIKYESVFCVFMAAAAWLWRDNPSVVYPNILYLLFTLLVLNLATGLSLRLWSTREWLFAGLLLGNCGTVTAILAYSGGPQSNMWVLYLLPIFAVCLLFGLREVFWITVGSIGFNAAFLMWEAAHWDSVYVFEILMKSGVFVFTAAITWKIVSKERTISQKLARERKGIQNLEEMLRVQKVELEQSESMAEMGLLSSGFAHDLSNTYAVILGYADLILLEESLSPGVRNDLDRIRQAVMTAKGIIGHFMARTKEKRSAFVPCDLRDILDSIVPLMQGALREKQITLRVESQKDLPQMMGSRAHLQKLLLTTLTQSALSMRTGDVLMLKTCTGVDPRLKIPLIHIRIEEGATGGLEETLTALSRPAPSRPKSMDGADLGLDLCSQIALQHHGRLRSDKGADGRWRFLLSLPLSVPVTDRPAIAGVY